MAFGNGAPDLFSAISALSSESKGGMGIGGLFGSYLTVTLSMGYYNLHIHTMHTILTIHTTHARAGAGVTFVLCLQEPA